MARRRHSPLPTAGTHQTRYKARCWPGWCAIGLAHYEVASLPRYLVIRTFLTELEVPIGREGTARLGGIIACNSDRGITWLRSYVSTDRRMSFCIYDAPGPEPIRLAARANGLPIDRIFEISILDPYPFHLMG